MWSYQNSCDTLTENWFVSWSRMEYGGSLDTNTLVQLTNSEETRVKNFNVISRLCMTNTIEIWIQFD